MPATGALSYSSYRTYLECPLRWKFLYVEHRPEAPRGYFTFGRVIHSVLEELVRPFVVPAPRRPGSGDGQKTLDDWSPGSSAAAPPRAISPEELVQVYDRTWSGEGYTGAEEEARYRALGRDLLMRFHAQFLKHPVVPVAVEEHLETRWDGIPIHGYIDRIDRTPTGGLEIVDYKTSRELSAEDARDSDQLSLYQVLVENNYAEPVERVTLLHLRSLVPHRAPARTRTTLDPLHTRLGMVADGIREQAFEPTPGRHCTRCDFRTVCPEFRTVPAPEEARLAALVDRFEALREDERRLEGELSRAAENLHRAAEELGLHRVPGSRSVAIRRREEAWQYSLDSVRPLLETAGVSQRLGRETSEEVRRLIRDTDVPAELRRKVAETGSRQVRWYWELENGSGDSR
ncbi:MAG: PD-(D/E)XK nuclease family protein [Thermoplasmata archaeon]